MTDRVMISPADSPSEIATVGEIFNPIKKAPVRGSFPQGGRQGASRRTSVTKNRVSPKHLLGIPRFSS